MAGEMSFSMPLGPLSAASFDFGVTLGQDRKPPLAHAVKEMETMFLSLLLKEMRQAQESEEGGLFAGDSADVYGGLFDMYMSQHLANAGGVGLATEWLKQLQQTQRSERLYDEPPADRLRGPGSVVPRPPSP